LLVVVAILALLVSILLPSLQKAKELGRSVSCMANLKVLYMGFVLYAEDNNGFYPSTWDTADGFTWYQKIHRFVHPDNHPEDAWISTTPSHVRLRCPTHKGQAYGYWNYLVNKQAIGWRHSTWQEYVNMASIEDPSRIALMSDSATATVWYPDPDDWWVIYWFADYTMLYAIGYWHNDYANIVFCDSHIDSFSRAVDLTDYFSHEDD